MLEIKQEKVKTGTTRLDDLLLGGIPFGSNVMIYGPPFAGKEVLVDTFVAEGLKKGIPAMWIITEKSPKEIREEMVFVVPGYEEYEKRGLVRYIDSYSRSMGDESARTRTPTMSSRRRTTNPSRRPSRRSRRSSRRSTSTTGSPSGRSRR